MPDPNRIVNLTPGQVDRIGKLSDQWSFFWDKRKAADLDVLLTRLPVIAASRRYTD
jgi:hypothetical protein